MKKGFVHTENFRRLIEAQKQVDRRGSAEAGLVIIRGPFGIGKSELVERWAADKGNAFVFCRAKETYTKRMLLEEVAEVLGLDTRGRNGEVQARIIGRLAVDPGKALVFDEADHLVRGTGSKSSPSLLEVIRDITDVTGVACYLVGMQGFPDKVARHPHIASRVARIVDLLPLSLVDVQSTCERLSEVPLSAEVASAIHEQSEGRMRLVRNAISNVEQWAQANGWDRVDGEQIRGKALCVEFRTGSAARQARAA